MGLESSNESAAKLTKTITHGGGRKPICLCYSETLILLAGITHNESHVCDVALSPTRAKGHVAERRAAAPRSPRRPAGAPMYIRAVIRSCAVALSSDTYDNQKNHDYYIRQSTCRIDYLGYFEVSPTASFQ